jgi:hypothetical protein
MADFENPFAADGSINTSAPLARDDDDDDDNVDDNDDTAVRNTRTIDAFLGAVDEFLSTADQRFYVRMKQRGKIPDERIHEQFLKFRKTVMSKPDASRHAMGEVFINGFHDTVAPHYDAIAAGDTDVIALIDHDLLTGSGMKERWLRAGPNVKAKFMTFFQAMVRFSNIYYLNISVDENVGSATVNKFKNNDIMGTVMTQMGGLMSKFSAEEKQGLIAFVRNPDVLKSAVTALFSGNIDLAAMGAGGSGGDLDSAVALTE